MRTVGDDTGAEALCGPFIGWAEGFDPDAPTLTMYFEAVVLDPPEQDATGTMPTGTTASEVRLHTDLGGERGPHWSPVWPSSSRIRTSSSW